MKAKKFILDIEKCSPHPSQLLQVTVALLDLAHKKGYDEEAKKVLAAYGIELEVTEE